MSDIASRIREIVADQLGLFIGEVQDSENLADKSNMDDLDQVEIIMTVEDEFGFEIDNEFTVTWETTQQLIDYVTEKV